MFARKAAPDRPLVRKYATRDGTVLEIAALPDGRTLLSVVAGHGRSDAILTAAELTEWIAHVRVVGRHGQPLLRLEG